MAGGHEQQAEFGLELLEEGEHHAGGELAAAGIPEKKTADQQPEQELNAEFRARAKSDPVRAPQLLPVVHESQRAEGGHGEHGHPDEHVAQIRPEQGGEDHGPHDQDSAHGRGAGLVLVRRAVGANLLAHP